MPAKLREKAPRTIKLPDGGDAILVEGQPPYPAPFLDLRAGRTNETWEPIGVTVDDTAGVGPPEQRLREQDMDALHAEVLFPNMQVGPRLWRTLADDDVYRATVRAYNDWLGEEYCAVSRDRLIGLGVIPWTNVDDAIAELEYCKRLGLKGVCLSVFPSGKGYPTPEDDRFWDSAQALGVAVHFHVRLMRQVTKPHPKGVRGDTLHGLAGNGAQACLTDLPEIIASGVHDRFPQLTWVAAETGAGWIPYILEQLDDRWWRNRSWLPVRLRHPPSVYFRRNWRATFMIDHVAVENREAIGVENLMWSTDYPHHGCDWPASRRAVTAMFRDVPAIERARMCAGNAVALYGLDNRASKQEVR